ncbi:DUF4625 domain-containing protein [Anditalea andensis]|uniref:DUF4625 domain-containing protein n=1 Tax=Anditalea andensis TaxID=1048983 RepID=A0A074L4Q8_9BACT|nr:DUF4625 domain-containing protein [Anditalea andensis]KEO75475.1 hypothetical protein EL17_01075 [Anditalea andensis]
MKPIKKHQLSIAVGIRLIFAFLLSIPFISCNNDEDMVPEDAGISIENMEIGSGNNGRGIIGRDFHLDMDVTALNKIDHIQVLISPRSGETYSKEWAHEITWIEYKGAKNTNVHKHFTIPADAPEGKFDFTVRVRDEKGMVVEQIHTIELVSAANLAVNPEVYSLMVEKVDHGFFYIMNRGLVDPEQNTFLKGEMLRSYVDIRNIKDDGILYTVIVKKSANHLPESVGNIDFTKVIVVDVREHKNLMEVGLFTNYLELPGNATPLALEIGASMDNHLPSPNQIQGNNSWENGEYYYGVIYTNNTHNMSAYYYFPFTVAGF